jgi:hypothetical protein
MVRPTRRETIDQHAHREWFFSPRKNPFDVGIDAERRRALDDATAEVLSVFRAEEMSVAPHPLLDEPVAADIEDAQCVME